MFYKLKRHSDTSLLWVVELIPDCQKKGPVDVDVLIFGCVCTLRSIPKEKFRSIKGLPVSSRVWTWYLLISRRACPFKGSPTHQRRFLPGIKKFTSDFSQYLIWQITFCMMTGPSFYFMLPNDYKNHDSWILWVFRFSSLITLYFLTNWKHCLTQMLLNDFLIILVHCSQLTSSLILDHGRLCILGLHWWWGPCLASLLPNSHFSMSLLLTDTGRCIKRWYSTEPHLSWGSAHEWTHAVARSKRKIYYFNADVNSEFYLPWGCCFRLHCCYGYVNSIFHITYLAICS